MASPELCSLGSSPDEDMGQVCNLCNGKFVMPRVLSCLHVYCEQCLLTNLKNETHQEGFLTCPDCKQDTKLNSKGVTGLPIDYIACNQLDMEAIEKMQIVCTSCKAKEKAVARCSDCATFLCPNCVTAHQYMRCFENHKVVSFEEMKNSGDNMTIHKPVTCPSHTDKVMKYYCYTCHVPVCNECMVVEHKQPDHHCEKAADAEPKQREELKNLVAESRNKIKFCEETSTFLSNCLSELQMQRDNVKSHVEETFQSYKVILEKNVEHLLKELDTLHANHELKVMETFHSVEKTIEKIDDACSFANRLLTHGNTLEILSLKKFVGTQLLSLINNTPKPDISVSMTFETDEKKFEDAVKETFGKIKKPEPPVKREDSPQFRKSSPLHSRSSSSFESEGFSLSSGVSPENSLRSLDVDLANNLVAQYNIAQLAGMAERSVSQNSSGTPPPVSFPDLLIPATERELTATAAQMNALNNLTALAKIGSVSLNSGQSLLNGPLGGLHLDSTPHSPVLSPPVSSQALRSVTTPSPIDSLESILNGSSIVPTSRIGSPLDGPLINGTALSGRAVQNSSLLSSPSLSSVSGSGYNPAPRSASVRMSTMQIRCKFGQLGPGKSQFSSPHGFCLGLDEEIIVADTNNHRIQIFDKTGEFRYQFGEPGKEEGQLWYPRKIIDSDILFGLTTYLHSVTRNRTYTHQSAWCLQLVIVQGKVSSTSESTNSVSGDSTKQCGDIEVAVIRNSGKYVICDRGSERSRMQIFTKTGHFLKKIAIRYIDIVAGLAITSEGTIVAVDSVAPTVFVISETGELLHWFDCSEYMREPSDIAVSGKEYYICDFKGHCVIVFSDEGKFMRRIGCENVTNFPNGIDISDAGDVLVGDSHGNRFHIVVFSRQGTLLSEFECPYVKVSRCCGLKITSEGYVVTLAKNNHHVLVLNTLYIV